MILGIIPARGGSKRLPRKNIRNIAGKPLIAWTIEAAKASKLLDRFIVSTEDEEIAEVAKKWGAEVLPRPPELAKDDTTTMEVLQHIVGQLEPNIVVLLQPTSPVRSPGLIDRCIKEFLDSKADSLATGFMFNCRNYSTCEMYGIKIPEFFCDDGNVYVWTADMIKCGEIIGKNFRKAVISKDENIEIDDEHDFWIAEQILRKRS